MEKLSFTAKTNIEEYLNNHFNVEIFNELTEKGEWQGLFDPLEFFNLFYETVEIVNSNKKKPIFITKYLFKLEINETQLYYFLYYLINHIHNYLKAKDNTGDEQLSICIEFIQKKYNELDEKLFPEEEESKKNEQENGYNFVQVKKHIDSIDNINEKIKYLYEKQIDYEQNEDPWLLVIGKTFGENCKLEIKKLKQLQKLERKRTLPNSQFILSNKKGAKIDLIRVLNAIYELRLISKSNEQIPTKQEFIESFGSFLGTDLSKYHTNLSQAFKNQPLEVNLKVFNEMIEITKKAHDL